MSKSTRKIIIIIGAILIASIYVTSSDKKNYHYTKIKYSIYDENDNLISDTTIFQLGEVKSFKDDEGNWSEFGIQNYDGHYVFNYISNPQIEKSKISFNVSDEKGEYKVVIDKLSKTILIGQTKSFIKKYQYLTIYFD